MLTRQVNVYKSGVYVQVLKFINIITILISIASIEVYLYY